MTFMMALGIRTEHFLKILGYGLRVTRPAVDHVMRTGEFLNRWDIALSGHS